MGFTGTVHLFCRVVDNFGDIGVCWRLARQLAGEYCAAVTLWVDDLASFQRICRAIDRSATSSGKAAWRPGAGPGNGRRLEWTRWPTW